MSIWDIWVYLIWNKVFADVLSYRSWDRDPKCSYPWPHDRKAERDVTHTEGMQRQSQRPQRWGHEPRNVGSHEKLDMTRQFYSLQATGPPNALIYKQWCWFHLVFRIGKEWICAVLISSHRKWIQFPDWWTFSVFTINSLWNMQGGLCL
jgi:hypothetical protein